MSNTQKITHDPVRNSVVIPGTYPSLRAIFCQLVALSCAAAACDAGETPPEPQPEMPVRHSTVVEANDLTLVRQGGNSVALNGLSFNGLSFNGLSFNGLSLQGLSFNGLSFNGLSFNGLSFNGLSFNGLSLNGLSFNGVTLNGMSLVGLNLAGITLNGLRLDGMLFNGMNLSQLRLNGVSLNGVSLGDLSLNGLGLNGVRLNGLSLSGITLAGAKLAGAPVSSAQMSNVKLALSYVTKCALRGDQCVTVTDVDGSTYSMCGESGLDTTWNTDIVTSVANEAAVTQCVLDLASNDSAHPSNTVTHTNREAVTVKDFFNHAVSCAVPSGTCVTVTDVDGVSTYQSCGSQGLDPAWLTGPATQGTVADQVSSCVTSQASSHGDSWVDYRDRIKTVFKYAAQCALREDQSVTVTDWDGTSLTWQGSLGLADWWASAPLNPAPAPKTAATGEELVSACLMARSNAKGRTVSISLRARPELSATTAEAAAYARHEGAFMGNLFSSTPVIRSCSGPGGNGWLADPTTNAPLTAGRECAAGTACGFEYLGACTSICNVKPGVNGETMFDDCAGNSNVVNTFLFSGGGFDVDDAAANRITTTVTGSTNNAPMVATADFNEDGNTDLAIENNATSILVRLGQATGGFAADVSYSLGTSVHVRAVIAKDVNRDGHVDLVTANDTSLSVLLGRGDGTFQAATTIAVTNAAGAAASVAAADFNGDGKLDLATNLTTGVGVFLGTGTGTFGAQTSVGSITSHGSLVTGDFNGDGKADLASASSASASVYVLLGTGTGSFGTATTLSVGSSTARARSLVAGDFNADGKADLAAAVSADNAVRVWLGQTSGTFTSATYAIAGSGGMAFVTAAYLDGDAAMDLLVGRGTSIVALSGSATGAFTVANTFDAGATTSYVVAGHFDRDATWRLDLIASSDAGQLVQMNGL
jgi:uncharacterized protein YjbI with pentapeptide repeats